MSQQRYFFQSDQWCVTVIFRHGRLKLVAVTLLFASAGCESLGYYYQSVAGHLSLLSRQRPINELLNSTQSPMRLTRQLKRVEEIVAFAEQRLALPADGSYRYYTDVERDTLVWSVVATPAYSLIPKQWCYPVVGCASYRGYFNEETANNYAAGLALMGLDVAVQSVPAYSTLGWFADPVPSTVINWSPGELAELLFHELAHHRIYVPHDSDFNEAYASVVAEAGALAWLVETNAATHLDEWRAGKQRREAVESLYREAHRQLTVLYARDISDAEKEAGKRKVFAGLQSEVVAVARVWGGAAKSSSNYNNAHLASLATYRALAPAFRALMCKCRGEFSEFHIAVAQLAQLSPRQRHSQLQELLTQTCAGVPPAVRANSAP